MNLDPQSASLFKSLLPTSLATSETREVGSESCLWAEELELVRRAVPQRRREFANSRVCARRALGQLGFAPQAMLRDPKGAPRWPDDAVGSISHTEGYCVAIAARAERYAALGVDVELDEELPLGVVSLVASASERDHLSELAASFPATNWSRVLFSAKESVYKAWYPLTGLWLDFHDVQVSIDESSNTYFAVHIGEERTPAMQRVASYEGLWATGGGFIATAALVH